MYRVVFEVYLKGLPNEMECLNKVRELVGSLGRCVGSSTVFACFYKSTVIKVIPKVEEAVRITAIPSPMYEPSQQAFIIMITLESDKVDDLAEVSEQIYSIAKGCGLAIRLTG